MQTQRGVEKGRERERVFQKMNEYDIITRVSTATICVQTLTKLIIIKKEQCTGSKRQTSMLLSFRLSKSNSHFHDPCDEEA